MNGTQLINYLSTKEFYFRKNGVPTNDLVMKTLKAQVKIRNDLDGGVDDEPILKNIPRLGMGLNQGNNQ